MVLWRPLMSVKVNLLQKKASLQMTKSWKDSLNGKSKFIKEKSDNSKVFVVDIWSKPEIQSVTNYV